MQEQNERLTYSQWQVMAEFLPVKRKLKLNLRDITDSFMWPNQTGTQWRNSPACFLSWKAVNYYFNSWRWAGWVNERRFGWFNFSGGCLRIFRKPYLIQMF
jgi:transposase